MSVLKGNISSVLRKRDNTLLDNLRKGYSDQQQLREGQLADAKSALGAVGQAADADISLALSKAQTKDEVQGILDNVGGFADRGLAAKAGDARTLGLLNEEKLRTANIISDIGAKDVLQGYKDKITIKDELGELAQFTPGTVEYKAKAEELHQRNLATGTPDKAITDIYDQEFGNADITVSPETIQAALGVGMDMTNPDSFGQAAYDRAISTISDKLEKEWTGIRDKSVFDQRAKDLLSKSQWGQNFDRQTKLEAGETTQGIRLKGHSEAITAAINTRNPDLVDTKINDLLTFVREKNITGDALKPFNEFINIGLERTVSDPKGVFESLYTNSEFVKNGSPYISPTQAQGLENELRARYRNKFPNLTDAQLNTRVASDMKKDGSMAYAIQRGKELLKYKGNLRAQEMKQTAKFHGDQKQVLLDIKQQGLEKYIGAKLQDKLGKFMDPEGEEYAKMLRQSSQVIGNIKKLFSDKNGNFVLADTEAEEAFNLAINRAVFGGGALRKDFWTAGDLILPGASISEDANKLSEQSLMRAFVRALPDADASLSSLKIGSGAERDVHQGILDLKKAAKKGLKAIENKTFAGMNIYEWLGDMLD
tara:strand:- start:14551 stop:16338 length:1788 start_codon:yes stop_codon:yes gene_type:complete